jgi:hypothetical protein
LKRRTSWERVRSGDGLKKPPTPKGKAPEEHVALYARAMGPSRDSFCHLDLANPEAKFIVRLWDGMDGCWCDCTGEVSPREALELWMERTKDGTEKIKFDEIDYYAIFPAGTRMMWNGAEGKEMFR